MIPAELTGRARSHLRETADPPCVLHAHAAAPFLALRRAAAADGFDLEVASGFRDFERQLTIWNAKYRGERPVLDAGGTPVEVAALSPAERIEAILAWSALPGASRHHWGTELDLIDRRAVPPAYAVRLVSEEFAAGGPFEALGAWLEANAPRFGFFRPYRGIRSSIRPEPWHWSFAPVAVAAQRALTVPVLAAAIEAAPLLGKEAVLARIGDLHARYVTRIDGP